MEYGVHVRGVGYCVACNVLWFVWSTDCENMGGSNEFFDKFTVRYHVSVVMGRLWEHPEHRQAIIKESRWALLGISTHGGSLSYPPPLCPCPPASQ